MNSKLEPITKDTLVHVAIPSTATAFKWTPSTRLKANTFVQKKDTLGFYSLKPDQAPSTKIISPITGKIISIEATFTELLETDTVRAPIIKIVCRLEPCRHRIIYAGTCTDCFEPRAHHQTFKIAEDFPVSEETLMTLDSAVTSTVKGIF